MAEQPSNLPATAVEATECTTEQQKKSSRHRPGTKHQTRKSKAWRLTYSRTHCSKKHLLAHLDKTPSLPNDVGRLLQYCIARETHNEPLRDENDSAYHLHAYAFYEKGVSNKETCDVFDYECEEDGKQHGNYLHCDHKADWLAYLFKEDKECDTNMDIERYLKGKPKRSFVNHLMLSKSPTQLVDDDDIKITDIVNVQRNLYCYKLLKTIPVTTKTCKGVWIKADEGVGKSHAIRHLFPKAFLKDVNKWFDGYRGEEVIYMEDVEYLSGEMLHLLKLWSDKWGSKGEVKNGYIPLEHRLFVVSSQHSIADICNVEETDELSDNIQKNVRVKLYRAIKRRFQYFIYTRDMPIPIHIPEIDEEFMDKQK